MVLGINISTSIDFVGQRRAERFFQVFLAIFAIIGFGWGFYVQQFSQTLMILGGAVAFVCLAILPPWPFLNRNPLKWQKPVKKETKTN